jgi:hypothetical protein
MQSTSFADGVLGFAMRNLPSGTTETADRIRLTLATMDHSCVL